MTTPADPEQGKGAEPEQVEAEAQEAAEAAAVEGASEQVEAPAAKPRRSRRKKAAAEEEPAPAAEEAEAQEADAEEPEEPEEAEAEELAVAEPQAAEPEPGEPAEAPRPRPQRALPADYRPVVRAQAKYVRTSARKARLVCDHIRGKSVLEARAILAHTPRAVARDWSKLLESAVANAEHNHELVGDDLRIYTVSADEGPTLKRFRPRALGRATRIRKRTSHLTIELTPKE
jgi:ribosomal protein L22